MVRSSVLASLLATAATLVSATKRVPGAYIFEFEDGHNSAAALQSIQTEGKTRLHLNYELFKGVSVQLHDDEPHEVKAARLASLPAIKNVWPVVGFEIPNPGTGVVANSSKKKALRVQGRNELKNDEFSTHIMTQVDQLKAKGITGKGIQIGVIDSGVDYTHPALGNGCFGKGCLFAFGKDLVGDDYDGSNPPQPNDNPPMDCQGHGTFTSGVLAAQANEFNFTGVAPDATFGMYRVFGCSGVANNDVLIAAYNQAYEDGADIITSSIGGPVGWTEEPWAVVISKIVAKGIPCTVSAANGGNQGLFNAATPGNGIGVTTIGSFDNEIFPWVLHPATYTVDNGDKTSFGFAPGDPANWGVTLPLYATSLDASIPDDGCSALPADTPDLSDKIVLIRRGTCRDAIKCTNAAAKGAKYILLYNDYSIISTDSVRAGNIPGLSGAGVVLAETGEEWVQLLKQEKKVTLKISDPSETDVFLVEQNNTVSGGALSTTTTWGPTWEMYLKPTIGAPGGNVLSTYPVANGSYFSWSGTSFSCPFAAGVLALISQVRGTHDPAVLESLLASNANPQLFNDGKKFYSKLASVAQQGGGLIQAYDAAYTTTLLSPSTLSFNDTEHFSKTLNFTLKNTNKKAITYEISHVPALTMYTLSKDSIYPAKFPNEIVDSVASLSFSEKKLTVGAGETTTVNVSPTPPPGLDPKRLGLWSGFIVVNGSDASSLSIPYQGLAGSLRHSQVMASDQAWIAHSSDSSTPVPDNTTFTIPSHASDGSDQVISLAVNMALGSAQIRADIVPLTDSPPKNLTMDSMDTKSIGQPFGFPALYVPRGQGSWTWNGKLDSGEYAPAGLYKMVVRALRIFGDPENDEDWDKSTTTSFNIKYD